jgi:ABC-2 type transport system permease protein
LVYVVVLAVGTALVIPGWSSELGWTSFWPVLVTAMPTFMLMPFAALFASSGRGYLPPTGWTVLALALANIISVMGWGDWFSWAVPVLVSGMVKAHAELVGLHSYLVVALAFLVGVAPTLAWWRGADQTRQTNQVSPSCFSSPYRYNCLVRKRIAQTSVTARNPRNQ